MTTFGVELDGDLATVLGKSPAEIACDLRLGGALRWYSEGRVSRRQAAAIAGVSESEFTAALQLVPSAIGETPAADGPSAEQVPALPDFQLLLLGNPIVRRSRPSGRMTEADWRLRKAFETVAFLALAPGQRASKDELVEAVWREATPEAVRKNFHPMLSEARRALRTRDAIVFRQGVYLLNPELVWEVDAVELEHLVAAARDLGIPDASDARGDGAHPGLAAAEPGSAGEAEMRALELWRRAWDLYRGPLLAGLERPWIAPRREALGREYLRALRNAGRVAVRLGLDTLALDAYRSVLREEPYEEPSHVALMEIYARQGRRDLVLRQFSRLQEMLHQELGEEPCVETQERYHDLMRKR